MTEFTGVFWKQIKCLSVFQMQQKQIKYYIHNQYLNNLQQSINLYLNDGNVGRITQRRTSIAAMILSYSFLTCHPPD